MTTSDTITDTIITARYALGLALTRYERLASTPRWCNTPLVPSLDLAIRHERMAMLRGDREHAVELGNLCDREWRRLEILRGWRGRSPEAWVALWGRLVLAIGRCLMLEALTTQELQYAIDRFNDVDSRVARIAAELVEANCN